MLQRLALPCVTAIAMASSLSFAQSPSPNGVKTLSPPGAIKTEGTWSLGARAGDFVFLAGMPGIDPATNTMVRDPEAQVRQAFLNIRSIAQSEGAGLPDCVRLTVYVSDFAIRLQRAAAARRRVRHASRRPMRATLVVSRARNGHPHAGGRAFRSMAVLARRARSSACTGIF